MLQIIYYSEAMAGLTFEDVRAILRVARRENLKRGISGLLFFDGVGFIQVLEGGEGPVSEVFARICGDRRHHGLRLLSQKTIPRREFGEWAMAFACPEGETMGEEAGWLDYPPTDLPGFNDTASRASQFLSMFIEGMLAAAAEPGRHDESGFSLTIQQSGRPGRMVCSASPRDYLVEMGRVIAVGLPDAEVTVRTSDGGDVSFNKRGPMKKGDIELF